MRASRTAPPVVSFSALVLFVAIATVPAPCLARTWNVPSDAPTIQAGIDSAVAGDMVVVECGTYHESWIFMKSGVVLTSETGTADCVTIDLDLHVGFRCSGPDSTTVIQGFTLTHGSSWDNGGTALDCSGGRLNIVNCIFRNNECWADYFEGGAVYCAGGSPTFVNCEFLNNTCSGGHAAGGGMWCWNSYPTLIDCRFSGNSAPQGGGLFAEGGVPELIGCSFSLNSAYIGSALYARACSLSVSGCTFYADSDNGPDPGSVVYLYGNASMTMENSIIAFSSTDSVVTCMLNSTASLSCCDVYGNAGGDWVGCIAGQNGVNGNFSADPMFCDAPGGDLRISTESPCIGGPCGLVGGFGIGCGGGERPWLADVSDVGNDQGRRVRLTWGGSEYDAPGSPVLITHYDVYRRQDEYLLGGTATDRATLDEPPVLAGPMQAGWDFLGTVTAHGESLYQYVAETLCDFTDQGICWSVFFVRAATPDPFDYYDSWPDSGYSVDNLAPAAPSDLVMTSPTGLAWGGVGDEDFNYYTVHGSSQPELEASATVIGFTTQTVKDVTGYVYDYYHVTATDFSGNEGEEATVSNLLAGVPGLPDARDIPTAFALMQNRPNPFSTTTVVAFDLPEATNARITIYDTHGRLIKRLTDTRYEAGRHAATWRGDDESGHAASPGVYFIRMEAGEFEDMKKIMLLR